MEKRFVLSQIEVQDDENPKIRGYAALFDVPSEDLGGFVEYIKPGAFTRSLKTNNQKALWNHNSDMVLGNTRAGTLKLWEDELGLRFEIEPPNTQAGRDAVESIRRGDIDGNSFGFSVVRQQWDDKDPKLVKRYLDDVELFEISPTAFPAYKQTSVSVRTAYEEYQQEIKKEKEVINDLKSKLLDLLRRYV
jgi:uncharacterized protein